MPVNQLELDSDGFPERLREAIGEKSARAFALESGLSPAGLHQYLSGKSEPTRPALIAIANTARVNLEWLLTGNGERLGERAEPTSWKADEELLEAVIEAIEELLISMGKEATPRQKTQLILALYDLANEREDRCIDKPTALRLVKLMAA